MTPCTKFVLKISVYCSYIIQGKNNINLLQILIEDAY